MENKLKKAFDEIKAEEQLKKDTYDFLVRRINQKKQVSFRKYAVIAASLLIIIALGLVPRSLYFTEAAYIDIDVNPSIELTLNKFNRVIKATAYNDDGNKILQQASVKNKSYQDALEILIDEMAEQGYIQDAEFFTATLQVEGTEDEGERIDSLQSYIDEVLQSKQIQMKQDIFPVDAETKAHAHEQNLTPAKYLAILEMQEVDPTATFDSCRDHTIGEIKKRTRAHGSGNGHGNRNGNGGGEERFEDESFEDESFEEQQHSGEAEHNRKRAGKGHGRNH